MNRLSSSSRSNYHGTDREAVPYGYDADVVRDGQLAAQVRTWMVCYSCGHEQQEAQECALCGERGRTAPIFI